jgi:hypothetical protein
MRASGIGWVSALAAADDMAPIGAAAESRTTGSLPVRAAEPNALRVVFRGFGETLAASTAVLSATAAAASGASAG